MDEISLNTPIYSGKNIISCWSYVLKYGVSIERFFKDIDIPRDRLLDEDEWFTVDVIEKIYENYRACLIDYNMLTDSYDIGYHSILDYSWGTAKLFLQMLSLRTIYKNVHKIQETFSKIDQSKCIKYGKDIAYIEYRMHDLFKERLLDSSYTEALRGHFTAGPVIHGLPKAEVLELVSCIDVYKLFRKDLKQYCLNITEREGIFYIDREQCGERIVFSDNAGIDPIIDSHLAGLSAVKWEKDILLKTSNGTPFFGAKKGDYYNLPFSIFRVKWENGDLWSRIKNIKSATSQLAYAYLQSKNDLIVKSQKMQHYSEQLEMRVQERTVELEKEIKARVKIEQDLKSSLSEKEVLLKEIHHRVKNNLQIISSLLDMTKYRTNNQEVIQRLNGAKSKIQAIAQIHSHLYQSDNFVSINLADQICKICESIRNIYEITENIDINLKINKIDLSMKLAIPISIVLNELIVNSFKHAFKNVNRGTIEIFAMEYNDSVNIEYSDNGCGIPDGINIFNTETLGLKLVRVLVTEQLRGNLRVSNTVPTKFYIDFSRLS